MAKDRDTEPTEESTPSADDANEAASPDLEDAATNGAEPVDPEDDDTGDDEDPDDEDPDDEDPDGEESDGEEGDDDKELALVGADGPQDRASTGRSRRRAKDGDAPARRRSRKRRGDDEDESPGPRGKGRATPKQRRVEAAPERTTPVRFVAESVAELRKVVWPTSTQLRTYFVVVLVFVLFVIAYVSLLDLGFGWVILKVLG